MVRRNLGHAGFSVITTRSPAEAADLMAKTDVDVVLCDYDLPNTDALEFFNSMRSLRGDETPPTLVLGDRNEEILKSQCLAAGTAGFWTKSGSPESLIEKVISFVRDEEKRNSIVRMGSRRLVKGSTDPLTQIATREHFLRRLNGESLTAYRDHTHLSLIIVTVDKYNEMIDHYGLNKAEGLLAHTALTIEGELRSRDCVGRHSDYTFSIILPDTNFQAASAVGRRLRRRLAATQFGDLDLSISLTVSIGVSNRPVGTKTDPEDLVSQALHASNAAKKLGGNRVVADTALTGAPLVLLVGDPTGEMGAVSTALADLKVEVRFATSFGEAHKMLQEIPVAMVMTDNVIPGQGDGVDLLEWVRNQFPTIKRVLASDQVDSAMMAKAINSAAVHYFVSIPWNLSQLPTVVDSLLFT
jgi:diguanylate cyclase (GGDEF)-like protein